MTRTAEIRRPTPAISADRTAKVLVLGSRPGHVGAHGAASLSGLALPPSLHELSRRGLVHHLSGHPDPGEPNLSGSNDWASACKWIEAGRLFELLTREEAAGANYEHIVCMDPWVASILVGQDDLLSKASRHYVGDASKISKNEGGDYARELEEWLGATPPFDEPIDKRGIKKEVYSQPPTSAMKDPGPPPQVVPSSRDGSVPLLPRQPTLSVSRDPMSGKSWNSPLGRLVTFGPSRPKGDQGATASRTHLKHPRNLRHPIHLNMLVVAPGDLLRLRVFLDSLIRQERQERRDKQDPKAADMEVFICIRSGGTAPPELEPYLRILKVTHPEVRISLVENGGEGGIDKLLAGDPDGLLIIDGRCVLPRDFIQTVVTVMTLESGRSRDFSHLLVHREVSAHVLSGNLDPVAHYEDLRQVHEKNLGEENPENPRPILRLVPASVLSRNNSISSIEDLLAGTETHSGQGVTDGSDGPGSILLLPRP